MGAIPRIVSATILRFLDPGSRPMTLILIDLETREVSLGDVSLARFDAPGYFLLLMTDRQ